MENWTLPDDDILVVAKPLSLGLYFELALKKGEGDDVVASLISNGALGPRLPKKKGNVIGSSEREEDRDWKTGRLTGGLLPSTRVIIFHFCLLHKPWTPKIRSRESDMPILLFFSFLIISGLFLCHESRYDIFLRGEGHMFYVWGGGLRSSKGKTRGRRFTVSLEIDTLHE